MKRAIMNETISIVGLGYVGLPLAVLASRKNYRVVGIDTDPKKILSLNKKLLLLKGKKLSGDLKTSHSFASLDFRNIKQSSIIIICVPTPVDENFVPNLEPICNACKLIAPFLQKSQLVILESTVNPGVSEDIIKPILEELSGLKCGRDFYLAHCPERINLGDNYWTVENIARVVGATDDEGLAKAVNFYRSIIDAEIKEMNTIKEAEAVKIVENSFRDINIAFVNELAMSFDNLGIDVVNVINGAATKPFAFMPHYPGCGVGGHCIPIDPYYLIDHAKKNGFTHDLLIAARKINNYMPSYTVEKVIRFLENEEINVEGTKVTVLGLSYKPDVEDDRESPSYEIIEQLKKRGFMISSFDPFNIHKSTAKSLQKALLNTKVVIVATAHGEFKSLTPEYLLGFGVMAVIDGRNCLNKLEFDNSDLKYLGIGR